jgi:hypothetical protein
MPWEWPGDGSKPRRVGVDISPARPNPERPEPARPAAPSTADRLTPAYSCSTIVLVVLLIALIAMVGYAVILINTPDDFASVGPGVGFIGMLLLMAAVPLATVALLWWLLVMHRRTREVGPLVLILAVVVGIAGVLSWGPWRSPRTYYQPEIIGVVTMADQRPDGMNHVTIEGGRTFDLNDQDPNTQVMSTSGRYDSLDGRGGVEVGALLLAGQSPDPWYFATSPATSVTVDDASQVCYPIGEGGRVVHLDRAWAIFGSGLKLRLNLLDRAYDRIEDDFAFPLGGCLNEFGEVFYFAPYA